MLQVWEKTTAEVLAAALDESSVATRQTQSCDFCVRASVTDKYSANLAAERFLLSQRDESWSGIRLHCDVHVLTTCQGKVFDLESEAISGVLNFTLSIVSAGLMGRWRARIAEDLEERIAVKVGQCSCPAALEFKQHCMNLFMARGHNIAERKVLLSALPNGDRREFDHIPIHLPPQVHGAPPARQELATALQPWLVKAFASHALKVYPKHRWAGADISLDELGTLMAVNGILHHAYMKFCMKCGLAPQPGAQVVLPTAPLEVGAAASLPGADVGEGAVDGAIVLATTGQGRQGADCAGEKSWEQQHARFRRRGLHFILRQAPLTMLMILRIVLEPLRWYLEQLLKLGGNAWETSQRAAAIASPTRGARRFRVTVAARGELEDVCISAIRQLLQGDHMWRHIPSASWTVNLRHRVFKLLSRSGASVHELLRQPHSCYPFRTFLILEDETCADGVLSEPACVLDQFSLEWRERFCEQGLTSKPALMCLRMAALLLHTDISGSECLHASLRRLLHGRV